MNLFRVIIIFAAIAFLMPSHSEGQSTVCATAKIRIEQSLTYSRQAFDAKLSLSNGFSDKELTDVGVIIKFYDDEGEEVLGSSDPNNTTAAFFYRVDDLKGITAVDGTGVVNGGTTAEVHWLIIPSTSAANEDPEGTDYRIGAALTYKIDGTSHTINVLPDMIRVKPLAELHIDYFLPVDVLGDDAFTPEIEPAVPYALGVRARNDGYSAAENLQLASAQPEIVENEQGLLVGFVIESCEVNGQEADKSLLVNFGDIQPSKAGVARWIMSTTLSGRFTKFEASYEHSGALGGTLTSVIKDVNSHRLIRDVLVDSAGSDNIKDFLANDDDLLRVYGSDCVDNNVEDMSTNAVLALEGSSGSERRYSLTFPAREGYVYAKLQDPMGGTKLPKSAIRSDGKVIPLQNVWFSKTRREDHQWDYHFNLFDVATTGRYELVFDDVSTFPAAPAIQFIADAYTVVGRTLSFYVQASDPNGDAITLKTNDLPVGASFTDEGNGTGIFTWTPGSGQQGFYQFAVTASDGELSSTRRAKLSVFAEDDTDQDGMADRFELEYFGHLGRDGTQDYDGDGITDLEEYLRGTDPTHADGVNFWSFGTANVDSTWKTITLTNPYLDPIVIASIPTNKSPHAGVFRLRNIENSAFQVKFAEWDYLDGVHDEERFSYIVAPAGRETRDNGVIIETGAFTIDDTGLWRDQQFTEGFPEAPSLYLTVQTANDLQVVTARATSITTAGFSAALFEQEANMNGHGLERVGYLAIYSPTTTGTANVFGQEKQFQLAKAILNGRWSKFDGPKALTLSEEASADLELDHGFEDIDLLRMDNEVFGQEISSLDSDTCSIRLSEGDEDNDSLNDDWELQALGSLEHSDTDDTDSDGLNNGQEYALGTNPLLEDTDGDGMQDGWEVTYSLNPLSSADALEDADSDGYTNLDEFQNGWNPLVPAPLLTLVQAVPSQGHVPLQVQFTAQASGQISTYVWDFGDGSHAGTSNPQHTYETPGNYQVSVQIIGEGGVASGATSVLAKEAVLLVVAEAGPDRNVEKKDKQVKLSALNSFAIESTITSYQWAQTSGTTVELHGINEAQCWFDIPKKIPKNGMPLSFMLLVSTSEGQSDSDIVNINIVKKNDAPLAEAGPDQSTIWGETVVLDGTSSIDPDGSIATFTWSQLMGEPLVNLVAPDTATPTFNLSGAQEQGTGLLFELEVADNKGLRHSDWTLVNVPFSTSPPMAHAGTNQTVQEGTTVSLDGSMSSDPDGDLASYWWRQISGPAVTISDVTTSRPTFVTPIVKKKGAKVAFELIVKDEQNLMSRDQVEIDVVDNRVCCFPQEFLPFSSYNNKDVGVREDKGGLVELSAMNPAAIEDEANRPQYIDKIGLFNSRVKVGSPGGTAVFTYHLPQAARPEVGWFCWDETNGWQNISSNVQWGNGNRYATLTIVDGSSADGDGSVNGVVHSISGPGAGCFIATAVYGSALEPRVQILRDFRDEYLVTNWPGKALVKTYYSWSPSLSIYIIEYPVIKGPLKFLFLPLIAFCWLSLKVGLFFTSILLLVLAFFGKRAVCRFLGRA